jgi:hypothetical protein
LEAAGVKFGTIEADKILRLVSFIQGRVDYVKLGQIVDNLVRFAFYFKFFISGREKRFNKASSSNTMNPTNLFDAPDVFTLRPPTRYEEELPADEDVQQHQQLMREVEHPSIDKTY